VGLFLLAAALRLAHLLTVRDSPFVTTLYIDPLWYDEWARRIASGQLLSERPFFLDPLYPYFLGAIYAVFGHHYEAVGAIQGLLGALVAPLVMLSARPWLAARTARLAGLIAAIYIPAIYFGGLLMKPGLSLFLTAVTLWLLSRALAGGRRSLWPLAGIAMGLTCLTRGNLLLVVPVLATWILLRSPADDPRRSRWIESVGFVLGVTLVLALPAAHNHAVSGEWILSTSNAGANFFIGNNESNESGEYQQLPFINANPKYEQRDFGAEAERRAGRALTDRETSAFWFGESWKWIEGDPGAWAMLLLRKTQSFWGAFEIADSLDYSLYRETAPMLRLPIPGFGLLAPLALVGVALAVRRRGWLRLLIVFGAAYSLSVIAFFVFSRFRMVLVPALYVFAAHAVVELAQRWRAALRNGTPRAAAIWPTAALVLALVVVNVPVRARVGSWPVRLARLVHVPVRPETSALGVFNLGVAYAGRAKAEPADRERYLELAEQQLRRSLELQRGREHARAQVELGKVFARQHRNREAIAIYREAARIEPNDYLIHHALGILHRREVEFDEAAAAFGRALRLEPRHVASATELGAALLTLGRADEAERAFRHALALAPGNQAAIRGLAALTESR